MSKLYPSHLNQLFQVIYRVSPHYVHITLSTLQDLHRNLHTKTDGRNSLEMKILNFYFFGSSRADLVWLG